MIYFDIETRPMSIPELKVFDKEFVLDDHVKPISPFDESAVKYGNTKDPEKRAEKLAEERRKYDEEVTNYAQKCRDAEKGYWKERQDRAALSALTGSVAAIGIRDPDQNDLLSVYETVPKQFQKDHLMLSERDMLRHFWAIIEHAMKNSTPIVGMNIFGFDLPFLMRRSWMLGVNIPVGVKVPGRPQFHRIFMDLMAEWTMAFGKAFISQDELCRAFGAPEKPNGMSGKLFHEKFYGTDEDWQVAVDYLEHDLDSLEAIATGMQL